MRLKPVSLQGIELILWVENPDRIRSRIEVDRADSGGRTRQQPERTAKTEREFGSACSYCWNYMLIVETTRKSIITITVSASEAKQSRFSIASGHQPLPMTSTFFHPTITPACPARPAVEFRGAGNGRSFRARSGPGGCACSSASCPQKAGNPRVCVPPFAGPG